MNFNHFAKYYDLSSRFHFGRNYTLFREKTVKAAEFQKYQTILEFGCGTSLTLEHILESRNYNGVYLGCDISMPMLLYAKSKFLNNPHAKAYHIQISKQGQLPFKSASMDAIFSTLVFHLIDKQTRLFIFQEFKRLLKPNGKVFLNEFGRPVTRMALMSKWYVLHFWALLMKAEKNSKDLFDGKFIDELELVFSKAVCLNKSKGLIDHIVVEP
jgi:ubiquinone/menaquinone biosynthesis C-methylase UbiE